jgi:Protein of unknown function (DUF2797)
MQELASGPIDKLRSRLVRPVDYALPLGTAEVPLNVHIGSRLRFEYLGLITCCYCGRRSKKSFAQGFCFPCFQKLARCDTCIVKPETCHYDAGTCREPEWAREFCMQDHLVYLANSSGLKVGITRISQVPTRWIDQGAVQALPILRVSTRYQSGLAEVQFAQSIADKTNWRQMLSGNGTSIDLRAEAVRVLEMHRTGIDNLRIRFGPDAVRSLSDAELVEIDYPVREYPQKPASLNLDKTPVVEGTLLGIKGQYLIFDCGVLNVRNFTSYHVRVSVDAA